MDPNAVTGEVVGSMNAMLLLSSSCQAVIEDEIEEVSSPWYADLDRELGQAEELVLGWRQSGYLYFQSDILEQIGTAAAAFADRDAEITRLFDAIASGGLDPAKRQALVAAMTAAQDAVRALDGSVGGYLARLKTFQAQMEVPHAAMDRTIADVQAEESRIKGQIAAINAHVKELKQQIATDRAAIAKAKKARTTGIIETVFGVVFAPFTGGASLILAGIGAASISDAEDHIHSMQKSIADYRGRIASEQADLSKDERIVATLGALSLSTGIVLHDITGLDTAMSALRTVWSGFSDEMGSVIAKIASAGSAGDVVVEQAWWNAAVLEWAAVDGSIRTLIGRSTDVQRVTIP